MNRLSFIKKPELFQGEKYLNTNKNYFEGWYFKNTNNKNGISFIPGININENNKKAFIQVITENSSYFVNYDINDFEYNFNPFYIKVKNNIFSRDGINIDIFDEIQNLKVKGNIKYLNTKNIKVTTISPNIMGPFSYIPFMECNHAIISMKNNTKGLININNNQIDFNNGIGYIEKDWGCSFPKSYIWCQGNNFENTEASFMLAIATIPFKIFQFKGVICTLIVNNKEYKFTTYNNSKLIENEVNNEFINITLKKGNYYLNVKSTYNNGLKLLAPVKGKMQKNILENICSKITINLKYKDKLIFSDTSNNCGLEIVK